MKKKFLLVLLFSALFHLTLFSASPPVHADEIKPINQLTYVNKMDILSQFASDSHLSITEANQILFSQESADSKATFARISYPIQVKEQEKYSRKSVQGHVTFYCQVSRDGFYKGIQRILYSTVSVDSGSFAGKVHYSLTDANQIRYRLQGKIFSGTRSRLEPYIQEESIGQFKKAVASQSVYRTNAFFLPLQEEGILRW